MKEGAHENWTTEGTNYSFRSGASTIGQRGRLWFYPFRLHTSLNFLFSAMFWPRSEDLLTADWEILNRLPISTVVIPSSRFSQKHNRLWAFTVWRLRKKSICGVVLHLSSLRRTICTPHSSRFARLAYELFALPSIWWLFTKSSLFALRNIFLRSIPLIMIWWNAPTASILAFLGIFV